jgi:hypothetical protein
MPDVNTKFAKIMERPTFQLIVLACLAMIIYWNTFHVPFVLDDESSIVENAVIRHLANFFTNGSGYDFHPNRYIGHLSFALNYHFGGLDVVGYHVVNLAIHIGNALLVYALVTLTLRTPFFGDRGLGTGDLGPETRDRRPGTGDRRPETRDLRPETGDLRPETEEQSLDTGAVRISSFKVPGHRSLVSGSLVPFLVALLFVCHPIQTQAVTYIVQRFTSMATLFFLAALVLHIRWRLAYVSGAPFLSRSVLPFWALSLLSAVLAMKTKEIAFPLPLIVLLYESCFFGRPDRRLFLYLAPLLLTICIIPLGMINLQAPAGKLFSDMGAATIDRYALPRGDYLLTQFYVIIIYLRLLVLPIGQNLDHDVPVSHSLLEPRTFLSLLLLLAILGLGLWLWRNTTLTRDRRPETTKQDSGSPTHPDFGHQVPGPRSLVPEFRLASFGIFWFFITLVVESSVIPLRDVIFEHRVYLPSVGFIIAAVALASFGLDICKSRIPAAGRLALPLSAGIVMLLAGTAYARNQVWQSWYSIWQDAKEKSPRKARPYTNIGVYYGRQGRHAEAIREFETAVLLDPTSLEAIDNLGQAYMWTGRYRDAEALSIRIQSSYPETYRLLQSYQRQARKQKLPQ